MDDSDDAHDSYLVRLPRRLVVRALMVMTAGVFLLVVLLLVFAIGPRLAQDGTDSGSEPFCCPTEGHWIAAVVNDSVNPCEDLYSYICTPAVTSGIDNSASLMKSLEAMITTAATQRSSSSAYSLSKSRAGTFLQKLYTACVVTTARETQRDENGRKISSLSSQMAAAIWDSLSELLSHLNSTNLLTYLLITNLRYHIRSVVEIDYTGWDATFHFNHNALDWDSEVHLVCEECVAASLLAYRQHVNVSGVADGDFQEAANCTLVTFDHVSAFATHLHRLYSERKIVEHFVMANASQFWPAEDIIKAFQALPWLDSGAYVKVESLAFLQTVALRRELTQRENWAVGAVYLIAHTISRAYMDLTPEAVKEIHCLHLTTGLKHLVSTAYWELYRTPEKEAVITDIYRSVLDAVTLDVLRHIVSSEDEEARMRLSNLMDNVTLVIATITTGRVGEIPEVTSGNYARSLLTARSFEFESWKDRMTLGLPSWFTEEEPVLYARDRLYLDVPASFYSFVRVSKRSSPLNMAVLGVRLAEILWRVALLEEWAGEARATVEALLHCFGDAACSGGHGHLVGVDEHAIAVHLAAETLALQSVMKAALVQDWHTVLHIVDGGHDGGMEASFPRLSHAQFFFLEEAQSRCPRRKAKGPDPKCFNLPAANVPEFERAFKCPRKQSKPIACVEL
ncbi:hypothetical protein HPB52_000513 [Rhipicephalus sanguineus]|uniref:Uncharacterized protein n=1 Tax=Rhipicephalus sanguineus TaxID=34632 RepID=A0A9D4Q4Q8_RHISA|nr:hypothetical protein HPB52_000513 [Rhipicephalus sanguineus]